MDNKRLDIEFKTMVIRFFKNFLEKADKCNETQLKIKHTLTEIKNIQRSNSRLEEHMNQVKDLECKETKDTPLEKKRESRKLKIV